MRTREGHLCIFGGYGHKGDVAADNNGCAVIDGGKAIDFGVFVYRDENGILLAIDDGFIDMGVALDRYGVSAASAYDQPAADGDVFKSHATLANAFGDNEVSLDNLVF